MPDTVGQTELTPYEQCNMPDIPKNGLPFANSPFFIIICIPNLLFNTTHRVASNDTTAVYSNIRTVDVKGYAICISGVLPCTAPIGAEFAHTSECTGAAITKTYSRKIQFFIAIAKKITGYTV